MTKLLLFASTATLILWSCKSKREQTAPALQLPVATVVCGNIPQAVTFTGETFGKSDITITARVNGTLREMYFKEGSYVRRGEPLYLIEPDSYRAQTLQQQAAVAQAVATLTDAEQNFERIKPLAAIHAASISDLDDATSQLRSAEASLESARAALQYAQIEESYTAITSPVDGVIGFTEADPGAYVGPGSEHEILNTVSEIDSIHVVFFIPEEIFYKMTGKEGHTLQNIEMILADGSRYPYPGIFEFVGRGVETGTGSFGAQVVFPNPQRTLRPGLFARIHATIGTEDSALMIPQTAVVRTQNSSSAYVLDSTGHVEQRIITTGDTYNNMWVILAGLKQGEQVITSGFHKLREGVTVHPLTDTTTH